MCMMSRCLYRMIEKAVPFDRHVIRCVQQRVVVIVKGGDMARQGVPEVTHIVSDRSVECRFIGDMPLCCIAHARSIAGIGLPIASWSTGDDRRSIAIRVHPIRRIRSIVHHKKITIVLVGWLHCTRTPPGKYFNSRCRQRLIPKGQHDSEGQQQGSMHAMNYRAQPTNNTTQYKTGKNLHTGRSQHGTAANPPDESSSSRLLAIPTAGNWNSAPCGTKVEQILKPNVDGKAEFRHKYGFPFFFLGAWRGRETKATLDDGNGLTAA